MGIAWSPDGERIATASPNRGTNSARIKIWDQAEPRELQTYEVPGRVSELRFGGPDELLVIGSRDLAIYVWKSATGLATEIPTGEDSLGAVTLSGDGRMLAATGKTWVGVWDLATQQTITHIHPPGTLVADNRAIALSANGERLAYNNFLGTFSNSRVLLADAATGSTLASFKGHKDSIQRLGFSPDGKWLASGSLDGKVKLWDVEAQTLHLDLVGHGTAISSLTFSPNGKLLATGSWDQQILLWDILSGEQVGRVQGHTQAITSLAFSPDGERIASSSRDGTVRLWKVLSSPKPRSFLLNDPLVLATQFSPTGDGFWTFDGNDAVRVWDPTNLVETATFRLPPETGEAVNTGPGQLLAVQLTNNNVGIYHASPFRKLNELRDSTNTVRALAFSRDGKLLAVARDDWPGRAAYTISIWDWAAEKEVAQLRVRPQWVAHPGMDFSRDNELIGVGYQDGLVEIFRIRGATKVASFQGMPEQANRILFLSDGQRVVCASGAAGLIRIWDLRRNAEARTLSGQVPAYTRITESRDGRRLAAGAVDGTITIWDLESYAEVASLVGHKDAILTLAFIPDGNTLIPISREMTRVWRAAPFAETEAAQPAR